MQNNPKPPAPVPERETTAYDYLKSDTAPVAVEIKGEWDAEFEKAWSSYKPPLSNQQIGWKAICKWIWNAALASKAGGESQEGDVAREVKLERPFALKFVSDRDGDWTAYHDRDIKDYFESAEAALIELARLREELRGYQMAHDYGHDCDEQLWAELGVPLCDKHGRHCWAHVSAWLVNKKNATDAELAQLEAMGEPWIEIKEGCEMPALSERIEANKLSFSVDVLIWDKETQTVCKGYYAAFDNQDGNWVASDGERLRTPSMWQRIAPPTQPAGEKDK